MLIVFRSLCSSDRGIHPPWGAKSMAFRLLPILDLTVRPLRTDRGSARISIRDLETKKNPWGVQSSRVVRSADLGVR